MGKSTKNIFFQMPSQRTDLVSDFIDFLEFKEWQRMRDHRDGDEWKFDLHGNIDPPSKKGTKKIGTGKIGTGKKKIEQEISGTLKQVKAIGTGKNQAAPVDKKLVSAKYNRKTMK